MSHDAVVQAAKDSDGGSPVFILVLCFFLVLGVIQVVRPQLLWKTNARPQARWPTRAAPPGDWSAAEATSRGRRPRSSGSAADGASPTRRSGLVSGTRSVPPALPRSGSATLARSAGVRLPIAQRWGTRSAG
ncbi:DUF6199 family natural product biosynthesis protein, partial [Streptomyces sp. NPDC101221]|uniref:DUF6199 family natural product biosynthesis protein n=1 Tax=Streptomyces sp. NPDC101221 TaxID=3366132 RepID=UPI003817AB17